MSKTSRGLRNNNPGNIRISNTKYRGEVQPSQDKAFKQFETIEDGYRAMFVILYTYQKKNRINNIWDMIHRYAPAEDNNDPVIYATEVAKAAEIDPRQDIHTLDRCVMIPIVSCMSGIENRVPAVKEEVEAGWDLFMKYRP